VSANFQKIMTSTVLLIFRSPGRYQRGSRSARKLSPDFPRDAICLHSADSANCAVFYDWIRIRPQYAEKPDRSFAKKLPDGHRPGLGCRSTFYAVSIAAVAYIAPWQSLLGRRFATAIAFEHGIGARWPVELILFMAFFGLLQCFNGNFAASTRLLFAYGRRRTIHESFGTVHQVFLTPSIAIIGITVGTLAGLFLGDALLIPVTEVGRWRRPWDGCCLSLFLDGGETDIHADRDRARDCRLSALFLMKVLPVFPGIFSPSEWSAFGIWVLLGAISTGARHFS